MNSLASEGRLASPERFALREGFVWEERPASLAALSEDRSACSQPSQRRDLAVVEAAEFLMDLSWAERPVRRWTQQVSVCVLT